MTHEPDPVANRYLIIGPAPEPGRPNVFGLSFIPRQLVAARGPDGVPEAVEHIEIRVEVDATDEPKVVLFRDPGGRSEEMPQALFEAKALELVKLAKLPE